MSQLPFPPSTLSSSKPWVSTNFTPSAHLLPARPSHFGTLLAKNHPSKSFCAGTHACQCHPRTRCSLPVTGSVTAPCAVHPFREPKGFVRGQSPDRCSPPRAAGRTRPRLCRHDQSFGRSKRSLYLWPFKEERESTPPSLSKGLSAALW